MDIAKLYGSLVRRCLDGHPALAGRLIRTGLHLEHFRCGHLADKRLPEGYKYLNERTVYRVVRALDHPESMAYTNIFAPVEILQGFGFASVSMEALSSFLAGFYLEDVFIDAADGLGLSSTLCSHHKNFLGALEKGVLPRAKIAVTTSTACDGNVGTFRRIEEACGIPTYIIDVPHEDTPEAEDYVADQLSELIRLLEEVTGKPFREDELKKTLDRENESKAHYLSFMKKRRAHSYPGTLSLLVYLLFATHLDIGMSWVLELFKRMDSEIESFPQEEAKRLFWIHIAPYAQETLRRYLNFGESVVICGDDFNLDYTEVLDSRYPLKALSRKLIRNMFNGNFERKTEIIAGFVRDYEPDGVLEFCHWGCRQSAGGARLLKERMKEMGVPMLILDGDAIDRRNCPDGQIRTRFEAYLEEIGI